MQQENSISKNKLPDNNIRFGVMGNEYRIRQGQINNGNIPNF